MWSDQFPDPIIEKFSLLTGITVNKLTFSQTEQQLFKLQQENGNLIDLCQPTLNQAPEFQSLDVLAPLNPKKLTNLGGLIPAVLDASKAYWTWEGDLYHLPHCWGSEAIAYRTDLYPGDVSNLSYGSLWTDPSLRGHVQGRSHSLLLGIGLWEDKSGNRMQEGYLDVASFKKSWDPVLAFAIKHKDWIAQFTDSEAMTLSGMSQDQVWIGQTQDRAAMQLKNAGLPVKFTSPKEGALAWVDGLSLTRAAQNTDQAYEFINYLHTPEVAATLASLTGYNPVVSGAENLASPEFKTYFQDAFPGDALKKLWFWPPEPTWYRNIRGDYATTFIRSVTDL